MNDCEKHEELATRLARVETKIDLISLSLNRMEEWIRQDHGDLSKASGKVSASLKVAGVAAAIGAAIAAVINIAGG